GQPPQASTSNANANYGMGMTNPASTTSTVGGSGYQLE
ncbi:hypothetical protein A2U01_0079135, partial [Trifolium medium]|nr:hypothetical protein [Trifolium medium]